MRVSSPTAYTSQRGSSSEDLSPLTSWPQLCFPAHQTLPPQKHLCNHWSTALGSQFPGLALIAGWLKIILPSSVHISSKCKSIKEGNSVIFNRNNATREPAIIITIAKCYTYCISYSSRGKYILQAGVTRGFSAQPDVSTVSVNGLPAAHWFLFTFHNREVEL